MSTPFYHDAPEDINLDLADTNADIIKSAKFIKNLTSSVNKNGDGDTPQIAGNNQTTRTPLESNELICDIQLPDGDNYCIGSLDDTNSKETYVHVWNQNRKHLTYLIGENNVCQKIYQGECLNYQLNPENFIPQNRNAFFYKCQTNLFTGESEYIRDWIFTDGTNRQRFIHINDSIKTNSFSDPKFRYSNPNNTAKTVLFDPCEYIELIPRTPNGCIGIAEIENNDLQKNNFIINRTWQFRIKVFDVWNRETEHGKISNLYVPATSTCQKDANGLPRCLELTIEAGSPIWSKIVIEFRSCVNTNTNIETTTDWYIYDTVDKYGDCNDNKNKNWFERSITLPGYDPETNTWKYIFCNEKECTPIPVEQTNRTENPMPLTSGALARIGNGIAFANNKIGYPPVPCDAIDSLSVEYEKPAAGCKPKYCDIEFWAVVHNPFVNVNEFVYNVGGSDDGHSGYKDGVWKWGGIGKLNNTFGTVPEVPEANTDYLQSFGGQLNNQRNFYAYLEGTDFKVQAFQQLVISGTKNEWGAELMNDNAHKRQIARRIENGNYYLQHFVFKNVPLGKYLIRLAGHNDSMNGNYQDSSTYVVGTINESDYASQNIDWTKVNTYYKELEIDTCNFTGAKFSTSTMPMIMDLTCPDSSFVNSRSNVYFGYLKDSRSNPVELSPVLIKNITGHHTGVNLSIFPDSTLAPQAWDTLNNKTDHNGFWFCACSSIDIIHFDTSIDFTYSVENTGCVKKDIGFSDHVNTFNATANLIPLTVSEDPVTGVVDYAKCRSITITGKVVDCNNRPVGGMVMCFTRSKSGRTNNLGYFTIVLHNDISISIATPLGRDIGAGPSDDKIFLSQNGLCLFFDCKICSMCVPVEYNVDINLQLACFDCTAGQHTTLTVYPTKINFPFANQHGLRLGSTAKFGIKFVDNAGRETFVGTNDKLLLNIPKAQEQLSQSFGKVKYTITQQTFPSWVDRVAFYWTDQNGYYDFLNFVITSVDINRASGKIAIGLQSIINYNTDNNFKTNTTWEFIKGDRIEFIADENGNFFDANNPAIGILNFQISGSTTNNSGVIDYDIRLDNLKIGTLIQLQRPKECNKELFYYEICEGIKLESNRIPTDKLTGYFDVWNSYLVSRKIRYNIVGVDQVNSFPFVFEHFAPSDLWGGNCGNRGKVNTVNPYEQQYCKPMHVVLSDTYSTNINGLSRFDEANAHQFDDNGFGSITAMITKLNFVLFICSKSAFVVAYDDNTLKVDSQGRVTYTAAKFSKPNPQNKELGCEVVDVSSIVQTEGSVMFVDRNNVALTIHNFSATNDVSENKFHGYMITKIQTIIKLNLNPQRQFQKMFIAGFDPEKKEYVLTQFDLPRYDASRTILGPLPTYINEEVDINEQVPETFAFGLKTGTMRSFYSFTPEGYNTHNNQLISFRFAKTYNHGIRNIDSFNTFYGVKTISVFDFVCNGRRPDMVKFYQWLEIYCREQDWFATRITTENGQLSQIPLSFFERVDNFLASAFLCDINTFPDPNVPNLNTPAGRLVEGDMLIGKWIRIKLISVTDNQDKYFEFQAGVVFETDVQKSGAEGNPK